MMMPILEQLLVEWEQGQKNTEEQMLKAALSDPGGIENKAFDADNQNRCKLTIICSSLLESTLLKKNTTFIF